MPVTLPLRQRVTNDDARAKLNRQDEKTTAAVNGRVKGIGVGAKGALVANIERHLNASGFDAGKPNEAFGARTQAAVKAFQQSSGLAVTGAVDKATWAKLNGALFGAKSAASPAIRVGEHGGQVKQLEVMLKKLGGKPGETDGLYSEKTEAAVRAFQKRHDLAATGAVNEKTMKELRTAFDRKFNKVEKPHVIQRPSPNFNSRGADIDAVILHHTAGSTAEGAMSTLKANGISAHYVVGKDGKIFQTVDDKYEAFHAGVAAIRGDSSPTVNARSIGIEIVNLGTGKDPFTRDQYKALTKLVPYLMKKYKVPLKNLLGHKDVALPKGRKVDPASNFDFERIRRAVKRAV